MKHLLLTSAPDDSLAKRWRAFLADASLATLYTSPAYFTDPYVGGDRFAVLAMDDDDQIAGVMTGIKNGRHVVSGMFSRPQIAFRYGVDRSGVMATLIAGVDEMQPQLTDIFTWLPVDLPVSGGFQQQISSDGTSVVMLDLSNGSEAIFARFSQTRRNEIRKAERAGLVEIKELATDEELSQLYEIYRDWNARKGNAADSIETMRLAAAQRDGRRIFIAREEGRVIAGSFYRFYPGGVVEYAANFSMPEYQRLRPNDLIGWRAIQWAYGEGFSHFSMGGSHLFLRRFGGEVVQTYRYSRDNSPLKLHHLRENARTIGIGAYNRLPWSVRSGVRRMLAR